MAKKESATSEKIRFKCRFAFLRLDKPKPFEDGADPRWEATGLLDPTDPKCLEDMKRLFKFAADFCKQPDAFGTVPLALRQLGAHFNLCKAPDPTAKADGIEIALVDGDTKEYDGFPGMLVVPAHNSKLKPAIANRKGVSVAPGEDQFPYSGSYGLMSITFWAQDNKYGKRLGINLRGCQFMADGPAFSQSELAAEDEFEALEDAPGGDAGSEDEF